MDQKGTKMESPAGTKIYDFDSGPARPGSAGGAQMEPRRNPDGARTEPGRSPDGARASPGGAQTCRNSLQSASVGRWPSASPPPRNRRGLGTTIYAEFAQDLRGICAEFALIYAEFAQNLHCIFADFGGLCLGCKREFYGIC